MRLIQFISVVKYKYSCNGIRFSICGAFLLPNGSGSGKSVIVIVAGMSSSVQIDNKRKDILILSKGLTGGLDDGMLIAEKEYPIY